MSTQGEKIVVPDLCRSPKLRPHKAIAAFPASVGPVHEILEDAEFPLWSPDGCRIAYIFNRDRMAEGPVDRQNSGRLWNQ